jgi:hypothetical protein
VQQKQGRQPAVGPKQPGCACGPKEWNLRLRRAFAVCASFYLHRRLHLGCWRAPWHPVSLPTCVGGGSENVGSVFCRFMSHTLFATALSLAAERAFCSLSFHLSAYGEYGSSSRFTWWRYFLQLTFPVALGGGCRAAETGPPACSGFKTARLCVWTYSSKERACD